MAWTRTWTGFSLCLVLLSNSVYALLETRTIDDAFGDSANPDIKPTYNGNWIARRGSECSNSTACSGIVLNNENLIFNGSWHEGLHSPKGSNSNDTQLESSTLHLSFNGTALSVFCILPPQTWIGVSDITRIVWPLNLNFILDSQPAGSFNRTPDQLTDRFQYNVSVFSRSNLENKAHIFTMALNDSWNGSFVLFDYASYVYDNGAMKAKSKTFSIISISTTFGGLFGIGFIIIIIARSPIDFTIKGLRRRRHLKSMLPDALKATAYSYRFNSPAQPAYVKLLGDTRSHYVYGVLSDWAHTSLPKKGVAGAGVYWLQGSGSSWRSAVAQRLAKECEGKKLLATFFFSNEDPRRNTPQYLALAIAHEMLNTGSFGTRNSVIQALSKQWGMLLTAPVEMQFERLVINAYLNWRNKLYNALRFPFRTMTASSTLIILDGLDECSSVKEQEQVLSLVLIAMEKKLPIRFLISSRPTQHLRRQFDKPELRQHTKIISLDSDSDTPLATRETKRGTLRDYHNATILFSPPYGSGPSMA